MVYHRRASSVPLGWRSHPPQASRPQALISATELMGSVHHAAERQCKASMWAGLAVRCLRSLPLSRVGILVQRFSFSPHFWGGSADDLRGPALWQVPVITRPSRWKGRWGDGHMQSPFSGVAFRGRPLPATLTAR